MGKKFLSSLILACFIIILASCGSENQENAPIPSPLETEILPQESTSIPKTLQEIKDYFYNLTPPELELEGLLMSDYNIYPMEENAKVNGNVCTKVLICQIDSNSKTNKVVGIYLFSRSEGKIYKQISNSTEVKELFCDKIIHFSI